MVEGKVLLAELNDLLIEVDHSKAFDEGVSEHLPGRGPFASARNEDVAGVRVRHHDGLNQRFVVDVLVGLCRLGPAVQHQAPAKGFRF
jgi:hypothetical protein